MYKKTIKIVPFISILYTGLLFADIDRQRGIYGVAEEIIPMDKKINRSINQYNNFYLDDEEMEEEPTITINDFKETENAYQLIREISDFNQTEIAVQLEDGILTISTIKMITEKTDITESIIISSSANSLFIPMDVEEQRMKQSYSNGVLKITLLKK
jgi:HSP20 family molecular chaperone IbpA